MKIWLFCILFFDILRFGGTPRKIWRHTCASRHTGWETLVQMYAIEVVSYLKVWTNFKTIFSDWRRFREIRSKQGRETRFRRVQRTDGGQRQGEERAARAVATTTTSATTTAERTTAKRSRSMKRNKPNTTCSTKTSCEWVRCYLSFFFFKLVWNPCLWRHNSCDPLKQNILFLVKDYQMCASNFSVYLLSSAFFQLLTFLVWWKSKLTF